mmetsp:Transcript_19471/g.25143  ORF Transcript_19471/g.25143 Transcript_19471/m.25143 type:complete len:179 (-) Transcript_19471:146-682(-)
MHVYEKIFILLKADIARLEDINSTLEIINEKVSKLRFKIQEYQEKKSKKLSLHSSSGTAPEIKQKAAAAECIRYCMENFNFPCGQHLSNVTEKLERLNIFCNDSDLKYSEIQMKRSDRILRKLEILKAELEVERVKILMHKRFLKSLYIKAQRSRSVYRSPILLQTLSQDSSSSMEIP